MNEDKDECERACVFVSREIIVDTFMINFNNSNGNKIN